MVLFSKEVENFLDKIYFYELSHRNDLSFPIYNYYKDNLYGIDKLSTHIPSTTFPMSRDHLFGITIGRLEFGYSFDKVNVCVEYYVNIEPQNDWFDWLIKETKIIIINNNTMNNTKNRIRLTESQLHKLIKESVKKVLNEYEIGDTIPQELGNVYDAIDSARQALSVLQWKTMNYENYAWLYPRIEKIDSLLLNAVRLADPNLKD